MPEYKVPKVLAVLIAWAFILTSFAGAQKTTGAIAGVVKDIDGKVIPGVAVTIISPQLIGKRVVFSDDYGKFTFPDLPPGVYTVTAELTGFKKFVKKNVVVSLEKTAFVEVKLEFGQITESIEVIASDVAIDITSSKVSTNVKKDFFDTLPKGRTFKAMVLMAPSVQKGTFGISIGGSTGLENLYFIDGINVTDVDMGGAGTNLVYEYIDEVEVKTGGYEAEFEGALGGVVNIITKSGGNEFHGSVLFNYRSDKLYGKFKKTVFGGGTQNKFHYYDLGFGLGGYLIKDKIWFFAAGTPSLNKTYYAPVNAVTGQVVNSDYRLNTYNYSGKLTFLLSENNTLTFSFFGDPRDGEGGNPGSLRDPNSDYKTKDTGGTCNFVGKYEGMFKNSWLFNFLVGRYYDHSKTLPLSGDFSSPMEFYYRATNGYPQGWTWGGLGEYSDPFNKARWTIKADITKFSGNHTVKAGFQMFRSIEDRNDAYTGGYYRRWYPDGYTWYKYRDRYRTTKGNAYTDVYAMFLQDSWTVANRLHLNLGVRFESEILHATDPSKFFKPHKAVIRWGFGDMIAPRVGFSYDLLGDATTKLFGSYARYYEMVPLDVNIRIFGYEDDKILFYSANGDLLDTWFIRHEPPPIQPGIKPPYQEEFILGFEREITKDLSLSVRGIYKRLGRIVEDGSFDGGEVYFLFNPGEWIPDNIKIPPDYNRCPEEYRKFPRAKRWYKALEFVLRKRFSNNYQFVMSYTYGRAYGNIPGFAFEEYGKADPNMTAEFDFPELMYNAEGYLPNDRKHQLKFDGVFAFNFGLNIGVSARYASGKPYTAMGYNDRYGTIAFLEQRGTTGRLPSAFHLDLHIAYVFKHGDKYRLKVFAEIFNVTNSREMISIYTGYDTVHSYGYTGDPSSIMPPWVKPPQPTSPYYGKAKAYYPPIHALLGLRFEF